MTRLTAIPIVFMFASACATPAEQAEPTPSARPVVASLTKEKAPRPSLEEIVARLEAGEPMILVINPPTCGHHDNVQALVAADHDTQTPAYFIDERIDEAAPSDLAATTLHQLMEPLSGGAPTSIHLREGRVFDVTGIPIYLGVDTFRQRRFRDADPSSRQRKREADTARARRHLVRTSQTLSRSDLRGVNMEGAWLNGNSMEDNDFRNASFANVTFEGVTAFSRSDLRGADFTGATGLERALWFDAICPDGTQSREHDDTCLGHLEGAPLPDIARDPPPDEETLHYEAFIDGVERSEAPTSFVTH